jgi:hypothetical protein
MNRKLPQEAFDFYLGEGLTRSYQSVAKRYGVTKNAVVALAKRERWQERLAEIEAKVRKAGDERAAESLEEIRSRHLKAARAIQAKAIQALQTMSLTSAMEAVRALDLGVRTERLLIGEPSERTAVSIEELIKSEMRDLLVVAEDGESERGGEDADEEAA